MLYTRPSFTCPTANNVSQIHWDLAFLSQDEFKAKYSITDLEYVNLAKDKVLK